MRKLAIILGIVTVLALAACGETTTTGGGADTTPTATTAAATATATATTASGGGSAAGTITMGGSAFSGAADITIKAGQSVLFSDPGGVHNLVTGTHGQFSAATGAPSEFAASSGVDFSPGDMKTIKFPTAGKFNITCTIHPSMQASVTVTP
jgi:plastocyanin